MTQNVLKKFSVVYFPSDKTLDFVPSIWISEDRIVCRFPKNHPRGFKKLQENPESTPDPLWPLWAVEIKKTYGN